MTRALLALILACSVVAGFEPVTTYAQAPTQGQTGGRGVPRDPRPQATGGATIRGRVLTADGGTPIRRAQIRAISSDTRASRLATTDGQGRFEFRDLAAGRWEITASKAGFVTLRYGQRRPFEAGRPIDLSETQVVENADLALPRGAAITGRVFDEFGDPVAGARVQVMRYQMVQGTRRLTQTNVGDQSDDTGAFRLFGLTPGDYYVSATVRALPVDDPTVDAAGYAPTYFPGTGNVAEAQRVTVTVGQEIANISFALLPVRTVRVTGSVIDSLGKPLTGGSTSLGPADGAGDLIASGAGGNIRSDGTFILTNVAPGSYTLTVTSRPQGFGRGGGRGGGGGTDTGEIASIPLTVGAEDLTGVYVVTSKGATLSGTVTAAPESTAALPLSAIQITTQAVPQTRGIGTQSARLDAGGAFSLTGLLGPRAIRVTGLPSAWMLDAITLNGSDVTDKVLELAGNQDLRGARVVVTDRVTALSGTVTSGSAVAHDYTVVVFPDDRDKWAYPSRYLRAGRPDQQGLFKILALPPEAHYLAVAVDYLEEGEGSDPRFLEQIREHATPFSLGSGESKALDLKLVER